MAIEMRRVWRCAITCRACGRRDESIAGTKTAARQAWKAAGWQVDAILATCPRCKDDAAAAPARPEGE